jgi:hypothetical protein
MPSVRIGGYHVVLTGHQQASGDFAALTIRPETSFPNGIQGISVFFFPNPQDAGYVTPTWVVFTPRGSLFTFDRIYHVLQTEKPLYFNWAADESTNRLHWAQISSDKEPIGEGVAHDYSV